MVLGCIPTLVAVKEATPFGTGDLENIAALFAGIARPVLQNATL